MINFIFRDVGSGFPLSRLHKSSSLGAGIISGAGSLIGGLFSSGGSHYAARKQLQAVRETNQMNWQIAQQNKPPIREPAPEIIPAPRLEDL